MALLHPPRPPPGQQQHRAVKWPSTPQGRWIWGLGCAAADWVMRAASRVATADRAPADAAGAATHAQRVCADRAAAKHRAVRRIEAFETGAEPPSEEELMVLELCTRNARPWLKRHAAEVRRRRRLQPRPRRSTV